MLRNITNLLGCLVTHLSWVIRSGRSIAALSVIAVSASGATLFANVSIDGPGRKPTVVIAGRTAEFHLALSSSAIETPLLNGDLVAIASGLAAPVASNMVFQLKREGEARPGVQWFKFSLEVPATQRKQTFLLRMKIRTGPSGDWLPLHVLTLSAVPVTWKETLRTFAQQCPSGCVSGSDKLRALFQQLGIEVAELPEGGPAGGQSIMIWFAEVSGAEFHLPAAPRLIGIVFKKNVPGELQLARPDPRSPPCVFVEADILDRLDSDPAAQGIFEQALSMARTLIPASPDSTSSP